MESQTEPRNYKTFALPTNLEEKITEEILKKSGCLNQTDFIRDSVRKNLRNFGVEV